MRTRRDGDPAAGRAKTPAPHHKMELETALRLAQASAALVVSGLGSDAGVVSFEHTLEAMPSLTMKGAREGSGPLPD